MTIMRLISRPRFNVLAGLARGGKVAYFGTEISWYESVDSSILALLMLDTDGEFSGIVFGRDAAGRFRRIHQTSFFDSPGPAVAATHLFAEQSRVEGRRVFPQGDEKKPLDPFTTIVPQARLHERFTLLENDERYAAARAVVTELMPWFANQDGNFVQQFQTDGFDARIWELYLFMMLRESGFDVSFPKPAPDFRAAHTGGAFLVEATTANPAQPAAPASAPADEPTEDFYVTRYSGPLLGKLNKRYWDHPHAAGLPILIAVQDFHDELSMTYSGNALQTYLYGRRIVLADDGSPSVEQVQVHTWGTKVVQSNFFSEPDAEHLSGVIFNSAGTLSKFNRIGIGAGYGSPDVVTLLSGRRHVPQDPLGSSDFLIEIKEGYEETWIDGLNVFHNPLALHPLDPSLLPGAAHHYWDGTQFTVHFPEGHLWNSVSGSIKFVRDLR